MKILALEFSSPQRSVALVQKAAAPEGTLEYEAVETGSHSSKPFEMIDEVLKQAQLEREQIDGLAVGLGPGSYTGIRSAIALAQGWQLGRELNLHGVSSAECVAAQAHAEGLRGRVAVVIDAQRGEFYLANYVLSSTGWREVQPLRLAPQMMVAACEVEGDQLAGPEVMNWFPGGRIIFPRAAILAKLALNRTGSIPGETMEPIYLRKTTFVKAAPPRVLPE
jgi:tRNA threonylcarbamoyladenosine biosynthesis protein TsaB